MKMNVKMDIGEVQDRVTERAKRARRLSHKVALASIGAVGLTYDAGKAVVHRAGELVQKAETRGEVIEAKLSNRVADVQEQMSEEARARRAMVEERLGSITQGVSQRTKAVEQQVQSKLAGLKIGDGAVLETDQIRIEVEVVETEPWEGYDSLNAQEVTDHLEGLTSAQLEAVRVYETNTKDRVTVLREIDMRQAALEEVRASQPAASSPEEAAE